MEISRNIYKRYEINSIPDRFQKGNKSLSGISGYGKWIGWLLSKIGFAFAIPVSKGKTRYLNRKSAFHWLNRHGQTVNLPTTRVKLIELIQLVINQHMQPLKKAPFPILPPQTLMPTTPIQKEPSPSVQPTLPPLSSEEKPQDAAPPTEPPKEIPPRRPLKRQNAFNKKLADPVKSPLQKTLTRRTSFSSMRELSKESSAVAQENAGHGGRFNSKGYALGKLLMQQPFRTLGLNEDEVAKIDSFVDTHKKEWEKKSFSRMRYEKELHALPRTVDVFKDDAKQLHIMVLCKKKGGMSILGQGEDKKAYIAIDWETRAKYADLVIPNPGSLAQKKFAALEKEAQIFASVAGEPNIAKPFIGLNLYSAKNNDSKIGIYMPFYYGRLDKIETTPEIKLHIMAGLIQGLNSLKKAHIDHRDLKSDNIYIEQLGNYPTPFIADFGQSRQEIEPLTPKELRNKYENYGGNPAYKSPERVLAKKMQASAIETFNKANQAIKKKYENLQDATSLKEKEDELASTASQKEKGLAEANQLIDATWMQHDTWAIGLLCLGLLGSGKPGIPKEFTFDYPACQMEQLIGNIIFNHSNPTTSCFTEIQSAVDLFLEKFQTKLLDPVEINMFTLTKKLLIVDPQQRILPAEALKEVQALISTVSQK